MDQHQAGQSAMRRAAGFGALVVVLSLSVIGLTRCRSIEEPLAGANLTTSSDNSRSECVQRCNDEFKKGRQKAAQEYRAATKSCGHSKGCRKKAAERYQDEKHDLVRDMQECKRHCYNEGSGNGGR